MRPRTQLTILAAAVAGCVLVTTGATVHLLFLTALDQQRERLREVAQSRARLIEEVARYDARQASRAGPPTGFETAAAATLAQVRAAHERFAGFGRTGEFVLARRVGDRIEFLIRHRHGADGEPRPVSFDSRLAAPMRAALEGRSGTMVGPDYRGEQVVAAFEPVGVLGMGVVAKIDLAEIRAPFVAAGTVAGVIGLLLSIGAAVLLLQVGVPVIRRMETREAQWMALARHLPRGLVTIVDRDLRYVEAAGDELTRLGLSRDDLVGRMVGEMVEPATAALMRDACRRTLQGEPVELDVTLGKEVLLLRSVPVRNAGGEVTSVMSVAVNITEHVRTREELDRLQEQLLVSQKMEAVGRLAGGIAHDFNNILMAVMSYAEVVRLRMAPHDPSRRQVDGIVEAAERAAALTRQLLAFSRRQVLETRVLDLNRLVGGMEGLLRRTLGEDLALRLELAPELGAVRADPAQLEQVLLNLAVNARDAMPDGGTLTIETSEVELDGDYASNHPGAVAGPHVMLAVSDTGVGMDAGVRQRVFEPFFTTKGRDRGTGLGLATVYGIVKQSNGSIYVYSEPGRGTTFKVYLPRVDVLPPEPSPSAEPMPAEVAGGTVLVVEDDEAVRDAVATQVRSLGYAAVTADGPDRALLILRDLSRPVDVLLTDVVMSGASGRDLAEAALRVRPGLGVVYMSGYTDNAIVHHGVLDEGVLFLQKPFRPAQLADKLRQAAAGEPPDPGPPSR